MPGEKCEIWREKGKDRVMVKNKQEEPCVLICHFLLFVQEGQCWAPSGESILKESRSLWKASWHLTAGQSQGSRGCKSKVTRSGGLMWKKDQCITLEHSVSFLITVWLLGRQESSCFFLCREKVWLIDEADLNANIAHNDNANMLMFSRQAAFPTQCVNNRKDKIQHSACMQTNKGLDWGPSWKKVTYVLQYVHHLHLSFGNIIYAN